MARYIAKFSKGEGIKFVSHLDLMRSFQRALRRASLPVSYSKGFNPHAEFSFATPLAVGTASIGEYVDISLSESIDIEEVMEKLNNSLPYDIKIINIKEVDKELPSLMSVVDSASYEITIVNMSRETAGDVIDTFLGFTSIEVTKSGKKGNKVVDIKPMIREIKLKDFNEGRMVLWVIVDSGSRSNLNPELIVNALKLYIDGFEDAEIRDITKIETYINRNLDTPMELSLQNGK